MKIEYKSWKPTASSLGIVDQANDILAEYQADGYDLSLRQLYYQFVARDLIPNDMRSYKRLGDIVTKARDAGLIDWDSIKDRGRSLHGRMTFRSGESFLRKMAGRFCADMWEGQDRRVMVWVEKEALVNVIARACGEYDVDYFPCKGYMSASSIWEMGRRIAESECADWLVLHLGDHDPSGIDMTRDIGERLGLYSGSVEPDDFLDTLEVRRIALNMDQVEEYEPPPNPAKMTDSRAADYVTNHGTDSWELDALEPAMIVDLIQEHINFEITDGVAWGERVKFEADTREKLRTVKLDD